MGVGVDACFRLGDPPPKFSLTQTASSNNRSIHHEWFFQILLPTAALLRRQKRLVLLNNANSITTHLGVVGASNKKCHHPRRRGTSNLVRKTDDTIRALKQDRAGRRLHHLDQSQRQFNPRRLLNDTSPENGDPIHARDPNRQPDAKAHEHAPSFNRKKHRNHGQLMQSFEHVSISIG